MIKQYVAGYTVYTNNTSLIVVVAYKLWDQGN